MTDSSSARGASVERQALDREAAFIAAIDEVRAERDRLRGDVDRAKAGLKAALTDFQGARRRIRELEAELENRDQAHLVTGDVWQDLTAERDRLAAEVERLRAGLIAIQAHGALSDNEESMKHTARVALNPEAISGVPEHLREIVAARFEGGERS